MCSVGSCVALYSDELQYINCKLHSLKLTTIINNKHHDEMIYLNFDILLKRSVSIGLNKFD